MNYDHLISLAPLALMALTGIMAMVLSPFWSATALQRLTIAGFAVVLTLSMARYSAPEAPATDLLADDLIARFGALLVLLSGLATLIFQRPEKSGREAPALIALATAGALATVAATHSVTLFLGLEITTLALVVLFAFPLSGQATEAGYKYFLMAGTAATALLLGLAFGFAASGSLSLDIWSGQPILLSLGLALLIAGLAFKFSLVPFHMWAPDMFAGAPASAAAFVGVVSKAAVAVVLVRLTVTSGEEQVWATGLAIAGAASVILGNLVALSQQSFTRMLGYSTIAHSGYLALVIGSGAALTTEAVLFYITAYAPALIAALCVAGQLGSNVTRTDLRGLIWRRPIAGVVLALALISMAGLPPAVGFIGKAYIFSALAEARAWPHLAAAVLGAAIAVFYYIYFAVQIFIAHESNALEAPRGETVLLVVAGALIVGIGIYPEPLIELARATVPRL